MLIRPLLIIFFLLAPVAGTADAQAACVSVDNFWRTLSIVRDIEAKPASHDYTDSIARLDTLADQMFLPSLVPEAFKDAFPEDNQKLFLYVSQIRQVVAGANAGHHEITKETLSGLTHTDFAKSMLLLQDYLGCSRSRFAVNTNEAFVENSMLYADARSESGLSRAEKTTPQNAGDAGAQKRTNRPHNLTANDGKEDAAQLIEVVSVALIVFITMALIASFSARRRRQQIIREERHFCNIFTYIRFGRKCRPVTILDITMQGMKIHHYGALKRKRAVRVLMNGGWHLVQIKWLSASFAGVQFKKPLDSAALQDILQAQHDPEPAVTDDTLEAA